jgi:hypothetical protein
VLMELMSHESALVYFPAPGSVMGDRSQSGLARVAVLAGLGETQDGPGQTAGADEDVAAERAKRGAGWPAWPAVSAAG